jgi:hypothetical protein
MIIETLARRLELVSRTSPGAVAPWQTWLDEPLAISPWQAWTLLGLIRHRPRQQFVHDVVIERLQGSPVDLAIKGALAHPNFPQQGIVPGLPAWEYYFHGRGCCLTHRTSGEMIDVDFHDATSDWIDGYFFIRYLQSLKNPQFVEDRLLCLHPSFGSIRIAIRELVELGLLEQEGESNIVRLAFDSDQLEDLLTKIEPQWSQAPTPRMLAAAVGDWMLVSQLGGSEMAPRVEQRAEQCLTGRSRSLVREFRAHPDEPDLLNALADIKSPELDPLVREVLRRPPCGSSAAALKIATSKNDPAWVLEVRALLDRLNPNAETPSPQLWLQAVEYLLRLGIPFPQLERQFQLLESHVLGDAAVLALEYFPPQAMGLIRRALRSPVPMNRLTIAAALAILDEPWSRAELISVVNESSDQLPTCDCRSALLATHNADAHQTVLAWEQQHPRPPEVAAFVSWEELHLSMSDTSIHWEMEKLHDRVFSLRRKFQA